MKLKVINFDSKNVFGSIKQSVFTSALSYGKMYELLHKQIWRKAPYRITIATIPAIPTFNGRPVGFVRKWDIKSPSASPYSYNGGDYTFGLNQLFVGQDYRAWYQGSPSDGIYHDDCYITPKSIETSSIYGHMNAWIYYANGYDIYGEDTSYIIKNYDKNKIYYRERYDGTVLINNVFMEYYVINDIHYRHIVINNADNVKSYIELGSYDPNTFLGENIEYGECNSTKSIFGYKNWYNTNQSFIEHGSIVAQYDTNAITFSDTAFWMSEGNGWIRVYENGTAIQFQPEYGSYSDTYYPPAYSILPMIYLDTGDLAMDRVEFVDKWDDYFELIVHEDSEWWTDLVRPFSLIIAAIIIYCSWGTLSPLAKAIVVIGYAVYAAGVLTNNTNLMLIGGIMMAGVSIYTAIDSAYTTTTSTVQLSTIGTEQALAGTSFQNIFSGYASAAGMENILVMPTVESYTSLTLEGLATTTAPYAELGAQAGMTAADYLTTSSLNIDSLMTIGKDLYSVYNNTSQLLNGSNSASSSSSTASSNSGIKITTKNDDENIDEVMGMIDAIIKI